MNLTPIADEINAASAAGHRVTVNGIEVHRQPGSRPVAHVYGNGSMSYEVRNARRAGSHPRWVKATDPLPVLVVTRQEA